MFELLFNLIKGKRRDSLEVCVEELKNINNELTKVFNEVMSNNISYNKRILLREKTILLLKKQHDLLVDSSKLGKKELREEVIINILDMAVALGLTFGGIIVIFFNILLVIPIFGLGILQSQIKLSSLKGKIDNSGGRIDDYIEETNQLGIMFDNVSRRLSLDISVNKSADLSKELEDIDLANDVIVEYINTGIIKDTNDKVRMYIIKILQSDLKSQECDFYKLLSLAKEKVVNETKEIGVALKKEI